MSHQMSGGQFSSEAGTGDSIALQQPEGSLPLQSLGKGKQPEVVESAPNTKETATTKKLQGRDTDDLIIEPTDPSVATGSLLATCNITLLLPTGARHPYKIDEKYLTKRGVEIPDVLPALEGGDEAQRDPFSISVYKLKELILREWRDDWENKPASPSSIRLIHFGKLLDDKEQLKRYQFATDTPNVVHMSVRPAEMMEEDEGNKGKSGSGTRNRESGGCCTIL